MLSNKRGNPETLKAYNQQRKDNTLNAIKKAVEELESLGYQPTIKMIMNITHLSRGTFQLDHVKELMQELKIGKYAKLHISKNEHINIDEYLKLNKQLISKDKQISKQKLKIKQLSKMNNELNEENSILRMKIYELMLEKDLLAPSKSNN